MKSLIEIAHKRGKVRQTLTMWCDTLRIQTEVIGLRSCVTDLDAEILMKYTPARKAGNPCINKKTSTGINRELGLPTRICEDYLPKRFYQFDNQAR